MNEFTTMCAMIDFHESEFDRGKRNCERGKGDEVFEYGTKCRVYRAWGISFCGSTFGRMDGEGSEFMGYTDEEDSEDLCIVDIEETNRG
jgi:hypothetical protein